MSTLFYNSWSKSGENLILYAVIVFLVLYLVYLIDTDTFTVTIIKEKYVEWVLYQEY